MLTNLKLNILFIDLNEFVFCFDFVNNLTHLDNFDKCITIKYSFGCLSRLTGMLSKYYRLIINITMQAHNVSKFLMSSKGPLILMSLLCSNQPFRLILFN